MPKQLLESDSVVTSSLEDAVNDNADPMKADNTETVVFGETVVDSPKLTDEEIKTLKKRRAALLRGTTLGGLKIVSPEKDLWYNINVIPKKSGGKRIIEAPVDWLKTAQRKIYEEILLPYCPISKKAYGCVRNRNTTMAAAHHVAKHSILKLDLKDCFHSINASKIEDALVFVGLPKPLANKITYYCTNSKGVLPQGAPSSPSLANIVMIKMYAALGKMATKLGLEFSGYLDDLVFSGDRAYRATKPALGIIKYYGFSISQNKISVMRRKQEVLGICVARGADHTRLPKAKRKFIRGTLHRLKKKLEAGEAVSGAEVCKIAGHVAYAEMAGDQKKDVFKSELAVIKQLMNNRK